MAPVSPAAWPARIVRHAAFRLGRLFKPLRPFAPATVSLSAALGHLASAGFQPRSILDVGAHNGWWTTEARKHFPTPGILMIEADPERADTLDRLRARLSGRVEVVVSVLGAAVQSAVTFLRDSGSGEGSSMLRERTAFPMHAVQLPMSTLDHVVSAAHFDGPYLLKIDVQGYELEVLKGAAATLAHTDVLILEVALLEYNEGAPLVAQVVAELDARGFVVYDVAGLHRRQTDGAMFQLDLVFVRREHPLRRATAFWDDEATVNRP